MNLRPLSSALFLMVAAACSPSVSAPSVASDPRSATEPQAPSAPTPPKPAAAEAAADTLYRYLTGRFDSSAQAAQDSAYFPVQLEVCPISLPEIGPRVLYVEQGMLANLEKPYRQRLYVIEPREDPKSGARSRIFEFRAPESVIGLCKAPGSFKVTAASVEEKAGCRVDLTWTGDHFKGSTAGKECPSILKGARYATSEVTVTKDSIVSWDRGYDATDKQVWGATAGPYTFVRKTELSGPATAGPR